MIFGATTRARRHASAQHPPTVEEDAMLTSERLVAFVWTADAPRARAFYEGVLGLTFASDHDHLMHFDSGAASIALVKSGEPVTPPPGTAVGWDVGDLRAGVRDLMARRSGRRRPATAWPGSRTPTTTACR
jgi:hypothetical protein